jgi:hypothetical protein
MSLFQRPRPGEQVPDLPDGGTEPRGVLLGENDRDFERVRRRDQQIDLPQHPLVVEDGGKELFLNIDDHQYAAPAVQKFRHRLPLFVSPRFHRKYHICPAAGDKRGGID